MGNPVTVGSDDIPSLRMPSDGDRELLRIWIATAEGDLGAYVNQRHNDDSAVIGRVVVTKREGRQPLYWVQCSIASDLWTETSAVEKSVIGKIPTVRAALDFIRPVPPAVQVV